MRYRYTIEKANDAWWVVDTSTDDYGGDVAGPYSTEQAAETHRDGLERLYQDALTAREHDPDA